jgi:ribose/xylose/arabinose/galactoside ABC-type transport system permease subunit
VGFVKTNMPWFVLIFLFLIFAAFADHFITYRNLMNILLQNSYVLIAAIGMTPLFLAGEIDLSVGYQISLISVVSAKLMMEVGVPVPFIVPICLTIGIMIGIFNFLVTTTFRISLLVVSLGTALMLQGLSYVISQSKTIFNFPVSFKMTGQGHIYSIPVPVIIMVICFSVMSLILTRTRFGYHLYAMGGNREAARLQGININRNRLYLFLIGGFCVGLATAVLMARIGSAQSMSGPGTEFTVITGIMLGGVTMRGGEGRLSGVLAGVLILALLGNGMQLAGLGPYTQYIIKGMIFLAAIGFDAYQYRRKASRSVSITPTSSI